MSPQTASSPTVGLIGFGAFGRLIVEHLAPHVVLRIHDPFLPPEAFGPSYRSMRADLQTAARCQIVVLAMPVSRLSEVVDAIAPYLTPGGLVIDVGSVKLLPSEIMLKALPRHVEIVATHPLFGPQSARGGIRGLKIVICPVRTRRRYRLAAALRKTFGVEALLTTPEAHDRELAIVQGLTHLIAKVLVEMEPLPRRMATRSFDLIMQAVAMVRDDSPEVFHAIERANPFAADVRQRFFAIAARLDADLRAEHGLAPQKPIPRAAAGTPRPTP